MPRLMEPGLEGVTHAPDSEEIMRRYRTLVEQLPLVVYIDALDAASSNVYTSPKIEPLLGFSVEEWAGDATLFVRTLHPEDRDRVLTSHAYTHATHEPLSLEYRLIARDGRIVWVRDEGVVVLDDDGAPLYLQGYLLDVTAEREAQAQLRQMALYDPLTGLANRAFFHEQLQHAVALRKAPGEQTGLLFVDLNQFKEVNDRFGHDVGDAVLARLGRRIQQTVRAGDGAARIGGDEFAVVLATVSEAAEASHAAERVLQAIAEPLDLGHEVVAVTASIGIALGHEPEVLLKEADAAMYRAKTEHDAGYAFFDSVLDSTAVERSRRAAELRRAIDNGEFTLDFQPVVELETRSISGYEALLRWEHPELGRVAPLDFIPLAEDTGLIVPLGRWVLVEACGRGAVLHQVLGRPVRMSVNVSARQLQHPEFLDHVEEALASSCFPAECLTLELTESVLLSSGDRVEQQLQALKSMGIMLALDDFGTGYASLAYLRRLPVDIVKIDRSFTAAIDGTSDDLVLLKGIVDLGNALGLTLVAEGIETEHQRRVVGDLGCHGAQGFYFGRPASAPVLSTVEEAGSFG